MISNHQWLVFTQHKSAEKGKLVFIKKKKKNEILNQLHINTIRLHDTTAKSLLINNALCEHYKNKSHNSTIILYMLQLLLTQSNLIDILTCLHL